MDEESESVFNLEARVAGMEGKLDQIAGLEEKLHQVMRAEERLEQIATSLEATVGALGGASGASGSERQQQQGEGEYDSLSLRGMTSSLVLSI